MSPSLNPFKHNKNKFHQLDAHAGQFNYTIKLTVNLILQKLTTIISISDVLKMT